MVESSFLTTILTSPAPKTSPLHRERDACLLYISGDLELEYFFVDV
jgi:hypothetical protein